MKKLLSFAAVLAFTVAVFSCGQKAENNASDETPAVEEPVMEQDVTSDTLDTTMPADTVSN